eukprot:403362832
MKNQWDYVNGGKTSVKIHNAPGGNSNFSLGWDTSNDKIQNNVSHQSQNSQNNYQSSYQRMNNNENIYGGQQQQSIYGNNAMLSHQGPDNNYMMQNIQNQQPSQGAPSYGADRSSVKIHNPPGGRSSFQIGGYGGSEELSYKQPAPRQNAMNQNQNQYQSFQQEFSQIIQPLQQRNDVFGNSPYEQNAPSNFTPSQNLRSMSQQPLPQDYRQNTSSGQFQRGNDIFGSVGGALVGVGNTPSFDPYNGQRQSYNQKPPIPQQLPPNQMPLFGQRIVSGNNCGPTTEKSSVKLHAPPGGRTTIQLF